MKKRIAFFVLIVFIGVQNVRAEIVFNNTTMTNVGAYDLDLNVLDRAGDVSATFEISKAELLLYDFEPASLRFAFVHAERGDLLTPANLTSFDSAFFYTTVLAYSGMFGIDEGQSYIGFGIGDITASPTPRWDTIGWLEFERSGEELTLLSSAVSYSELLGGPSGPDGLVVGVPEPATATLIIGAFGFLLRRRF